MVDVKIKQVPHQPSMSFRGRRWHNFAWVDFEVKLNRTEQHTKPNGDIYWVAFSDNAQVNIAFNMNDQDVPGNVFFVPAGAWYVVRALHSVRLRIYRRYF